MRIFVKIKNDVQIVEADAGPPTPTPEAPWEGPSLCVCVRLISGSRQTSIYGCRQQKQGGKVYTVNRGKVRPKD